LIKTLWTDEVKIELLRGSMKSSIDRGNFMYLGYATACSAGITGQTVPSGKKALGKIGDLMVTLDALQRSCVGMRGTSN